ncbi:GbsR/MarR family transcriptional regulator [Streptomyces albus]|uniref:GbsR/MarR family transcriptional regulator n=1 Tax=Streptomyces albus TaxID=1888 RepID=UPI00068F855C|nr:MarR family transcriptional regulator [Streptomyces albus]
MTDSTQNPADGEHEADRPLVPVDDADMPPAGARRFAEEVAGAFHAQGFPRMPARVLMALTINPTEGLTTTQLRKQLGVGSAAISAAVSYAQSVGLIRVRSMPGARQQVYSLARDDWYRAVISRTAFYSSMADLCRHQTDTLDEPGGELTRRRIEDMGRFFAFLIAKFPPLLAEWDREHDNSAGQG